MRSIDSTLLRYEASFPQKYYDSASWVFSGSRGLSEDGQCVLRGLVNKHRFMCHNIGTADVTEGRLCALHCVEAAKVGAWKPYCVRVVLGDFQNCSSLSEFNPEVEHTIVEPRC